MWIVIHAFLRGLALFWPGREVLVCTTTCVYYSSTATAAAAAGLDEPLLFPLNSFDLWLNLFYSVGIKWWQTYFDHDHHRSSPWWTTNRILFMQPFKSKIKMGRQSPNLNQI